MKQSILHYELEEVRATCYHEAGHAVAASHFHIQFEIKIYIGGKPDGVNSGIAGEVLFCSKLKPFQRAVISWAGPLAEEAINTTEPEKLLNDQGWVYQRFCTLLECEEINEIDKAGIVGHPQKWRSCKLAAAIMAKKFCMLKNLADHQILKNRIFARSSSRTAPRRPGRAERRIVPGNNFEI